MARSFLQRALEAEEKALLDQQAARLERKESGELLLGKRRIAKRQIRRRGDQHPIGLDDQVPGVVAQYVGTNGVVKTVPITYRDLGNIKAQEMAAFQAQNLTPQMRARLEARMEDLANAHGHAWQAEDLAKRKQQAKR